MPGSSSSYKLSEFTKLSSLSAPAPTPSTSSLPPPPSTLSTAKLKVIKLEAVDEAVDKAAVVKEADKMAAVVKVAVSKAVIESGKDPVSTDTELTGESTAG
jgi:hypothetical protein